MHNPLHQLCDGAGQRDGPIRFHLAGRFAGLQEGDYSSALPLARDDPARERLVERTEERCARRPR